MQKLITQDVAFNIAQHCKEAWQFATPNANTGEIIIQKGLTPFYPDTQKKGGPLTIVDIKVNNFALDIKCREVLEIYTKPIKKKSPNKTYFTVDDIGITVSRPNSIETPVRRPSVDVKNYQGDSETIVTEQIKEYYYFAHRTTSQADCNHLNSILFLYGCKNDYKAIYIEEQEFSTPMPKSFETYLNKKNKPAAYLAYDNHKKLLYRLMDYSKGSTNFIKRFDCANGYLFVWKEEQREQKICTKEDWDNQGGYAF